MNSDEMKKPIDWAPWVPLAPLLSAWWLQMEPGSPPGLPTCPLGKLDTGPLGWTRRLGDG